MGRLDRLKLMAEITSYVTSAAATVFDRVKNFSDLSTRISELEKEVGELKGKAKP